MIHFVVDGTVNFGTGVRQIVAPEGYAFDEAEPTLGLMSSIRLCLSLGSLALRVNVYASFRSELLAVNIEGNANTAEEVSKTSPHGTNASVRLNSACVATSC